jgi:hypothetical protein
VGIQSSKAVLTVQQMYREVAGRRAESESMLPRERLRRMITGVFLVGFRAELALP